MFVLALSLYNTWNRGVFLLCKITNLLIYRRETDFSYNRLDGGRTYSCSYTGTLEEPYMSAGVVQYYVYSEGWRIWFEAYSS